MPFEKYQKTGGFPARDILAFKEVASSEYCVIASRELSPFATDLILDNYAAKPFAIKAKTCDFGPIAGFVSTDPRFCKLKQGWDLERQEHELDHAFEKGAVCAPIFISDKRLESLLAERAGLQIIKRTADVCDVQAQSSASDHPLYRFRLVKCTNPPGGTGAMWAVYYRPAQMIDAKAVRREPMKQVSAFPRVAELTPVYGMVNPEDKDGARGVKSTCSGDYDLWHVFPHSSWAARNIRQLDERRMALRATMPFAQPGIRNRAAAMGLIYARNEQEQRQARALLGNNIADVRGRRERVQILSQVAEEREDPVLGNISAGIDRIKKLLNAACIRQGYRGGNIVQHSDYGGNPFADIDFPLVFFVPQAKQGQVEVYVANQAGGRPQLNAILNYIRKKEFRVAINPHMWLPNWQVGFLPPPVA